MKSLDYQVVNQNYYDGDTSLLDDVIYLSDPKNEITDRKITNIVLKYIFCFYYLNSVNIKVSFNELVYFFDKINTIGDKEVLEDDIVTDLATIEGFYKIQEYPLRMAMDIASTVKLVKDIISRLINKDSFGGKYVGMDLGSGIGILTLAQGIQARRNGFNKITNIGFELGEITSIYSTQILELLDLGKVVPQDTTKSSLFTNIPQYEDITFISNETLCDPYSPINKGRVDSDPFFENNRNIFRNADMLMNRETQFFPESVKVTNGREIVLLDKNNHFTDNKVHGPNASDEYYFKDIYIGGKFVGLEDIGEDLHSGGLIKKAPNLGARWCIKR